MRKYDIIISDIYIIVKYRRFFVIRNKNRHPRTYRKEKTMKNEEKKELNDKEAEQVTGGVNEELAALRAEKIAEKVLPECSVEYIRRIGK